MRLPILAVAFAAIALSSCDDPNPGLRPADSNTIPPKEYRTDTFADRAIFTKDPEAECAYRGAIIIAGSEIRACVHISNGTKTIILPNPCNETGSYARLVCHELGHLNGWMHL